MLDAEFLNEAVLGGAACTGKRGRVLVDVSLLSVSPPFDCDCGPHAGSSLRRKYLSLTEFRIDAVRTEVLQFQRLER